MRMQSWIDITSPHGLVDDLRVLQWDRLVQGIVHKLCTLLHVGCKVEGLCFRCSKLLCNSCLNRIADLQCMEAASISPQSRQSKANVPFISQCKV